MDEYDRLKLSLQAALVGMVPDNLFAVTCNLASRQVSIVAYFDGAVGREEKELLRHLVREVVGDLPDGYDVAPLAYSIQERPAHMLDFWAFLRAEPKNAKTTVSQMPRPPKAASNY